MKKVFINITLFVLALLMFTGCGATTYSFKESVDEIDSIEIVSAENSLEFTVTKTLSETEKNDFLEQFRSIEFKNYIGDPPAVHGDAIKITYQSGNYEMISYYANEYVKNGEIHFLWRCCDEEDFNKLLNNFLE